MESKLEPYLSFNNNTRQAMEFYKTIFGGKLEFNTFKDFNASKDPSEDDLIMHSTLKAPNGISFMASDTPKRIEFKPTAGFNMSLTGENEIELRNYFEKLANGGIITMPLEKAIWGDTFGMCVDKYGISWIVNISSTSK